MSEVKKSVIDGSIENMAKVKFKSFEDVIRYAIGREVEAYEFYQELAGRTEEPGLHRVIMDFAKEELRHKAKVEDGRGKLEGGRWKVEGGIGIQERVI